MSEPAETPRTRRWLWRTGAEVRKERVKLIAGGLNAVGLALIIGTLVAPTIDPARAFDLVRFAIGAGAGLLLMLAALITLGYITLDHLGLYYEGGVTTMDPFYGAVLGALVAGAGMIGALIAAPYLDRARFALEDRFRRR